MDLNIADVFIILTLAISIGIGIYRGFIREFLTIITWLVALFFAYIWGKEAGDYIFFVDDPYTKQILGMIAVFFGVIFVGFLLKVIICKVAKISGVSTVDRVTGGFFGALRGCLLIVLVLYMSSKNITNQDWYKKSKFLPRFVTAANMIPKSWQDDFHKEIDDLMHAEQPPAPVTAAQPTSVKADKSPASGSAVTPTKEKKPNAPAVNKATAPATPAANKAAAPDTPAATTD